MDMNKNNNNKPTLYQPNPPTVYQPTPPEKFLDSTNFDFSKTSLIKPPFNEAKNIGKETWTRLVIDSRDRDMKIYPNPNQYSIDLETDVLEVTSAEIVNNEVDVSLYTVHLYNNTFTLKDSNNNSKIVVLNQGNFDATTILPNIANSLGTDYTATYDAVKDIISINTSIPNKEFTLEFYNNSDICLILGFIGGIPYSSTNGVLTAPFRTNFGISRYVVMNIAQFTINNSANSVIHKSTAIFSKFHIMKSIIPIKKYFNPPIARLLKISIWFTDYYGNPFDFQNKDHRIEILLESKKMLSRYTF